MSLQSSSALLGSPEYVTVEKYHHTATTHTKHILSKVSQFTSDNVYI